MLATSPVLHTHFDVTSCVMQNNLCDALVGHAPLDFCKLVCVVF